MKKLTTIICSIAFMISGIMMALNNSTVDVDVGHGLEINAATVSYLNDFNHKDIPLHPYTMQVRETNEKDTVTLVKYDTVQVTTTKIQKVPVPEYVVETVYVTDTLYYLATQVGNKEGPSDNGGIIYEVHKIDNINPVNIISPEVEIETEEPVFTTNSAENI